MNQEQFKIKFRLSFYKHTKRNEYFSDEFKIVNLDQVSVSVLESSSSEFISDELYIASSNQPFTIVIIRKGKKFPEMASITVNGSAYQPSLFFLS